MDNTETLRTRWELEKCQDAIIYLKLHIFCEEYGKSLVLRKVSMRKQNTNRAVPLDVVPERRTKRCSPRFRPGYRFCELNFGTCRQAVRERALSPRTICERSLSSTQPDS